MLEEKTEDKRGLVLCREVTRPKNIRQPKSRRDGKPRKAPYDDVMGGRNKNIVTGARAAIKAWLRGYDKGATGPK